MTHDFEEEGMASGIYISHWSLRELCGSGSLLGSVKRSIVTQGTRGKVTLPSNVAIFLSRLALNIQTVWAKSIKCTRCNCLHNEGLGPTESSIVQVQDRPHAAIVQR